MAETILAAADVIALAPCDCRANEQACDAPFDACLTLNEAARRTAETSPGARYVTFAGACETLRMSHEAGLVHLAYRQDSGPVTEFCSCCSCCCWVLRRVRKLGAFDAITPSAYITVRDDGACISCGRRIERCPFGAWTASNAGKPAFVEANCYECGVCVTTCLSDALALVERMRMDSDEPGG